MSDIPKNFIIKCTSCGWKELTSGVSSELTHLIEIPNSCPSCGKPRCFKCASCSGKAKMFRIKGNK